MKNRVGSFASALFFCVFQKFPTSVRREMPQSHRGGDTPGAMPNPAVKPREDASSRPKAQNICRVIFGVLTYAFKTICRMFHTFRRKSAASRKSFADGTAEGICGMSETGNLRFPLSNLVFPPRVGRRRDRSKNRAFSVIAGALFFCRL